MKAWPVQDAKARFSEFLDSCQTGGPQLVTRRGAEAAVLISIQDWKRLAQERRPTLKELLLAAEPRFEFEIPPRGQLPSRPPPVFD